MQSQPDQPIPERCLQEIFCERFRCPPEEYEERFFWMCVRPNVIFLAKILWIFYRRIFYTDLEMLKQLGRTTSSRELRYELESFRHYHPPRGFIRRDLKVRVSGRRLLKIGSKLFGLEASRRARSLRMVTVNNPTTPAQNTAVSQSVSPEAQIQQQQQSSQKVEVVKEQPPRAEEQAVNQTRQNP